MATLRRLHARELLDSRGRPTVEVEVWGSDGSRGRAIVPSGASTGRHEAVELRDGDRSRFDGKGTRVACRNVREVIQPELIDRDLEDQAGIDAAMIALDGTTNRGRLGGNAILGVSMAVAHAAADARREPLFEYLHGLSARLNGRDDPPGPPASLPMPMVNLISGGLHAGRQLDLQDYLMIPIAARSYSEALAMIAEVYRSLGEVLRGHGEEGTLVGDEGGYGPRLSGNRQPLDRLMEAFRAAGLEPGRDVAIAIDVAATQLHDPATGRYALNADGSGPIESGQLIDIFQTWVHDYPIVSIEDGLAEDDHDGWVALTARLGGSVQLIGDDLFATQVDRLAQGIERGIANAILIKMNQVGTLTETFAALAMARRHGYRTIVSARSGETEDATMADLAVGLSAGQIKIGSIARSERLAKYNQLLRIEEALGGPDLAPFAGAGALARSRGSRT